MQVEDLFIIIREFKKIMVLQANLLEFIKLTNDKSEVYRQQLESYENTQKLISEYERFSI